MEERVRATSCGARGNCCRTSARRFLASCSITSTFSRTTITTISVTTARDTTRAMRKATPNARLYEWQRAKSKALGAKGKEKLRPHFRFEDLELWQLARDLAVKL